MAFTLCSSVYTLPLALRFSASTCRSRGSGQADSPQFICQVLLADNCSVLAALSLQLLCKPLQNNIYRLRWGLQLKCQVLAHSMAYLPKKLGFCASCCRLQDRAELM